MASLSQYEKLRQKNLEDNRRILAEIGLANPFRGLPKVTLNKGVFNRANKRKSEDVLSRPAKKRVVEDLESSGSLRGTKRKSARLQGKDIPTKKELEEEVEEWEESENRPRPVDKHRPNFHGAVDGVEVGTVWETRIECCRAGIHRPTVAGIHGGVEGAFSIALSGGYDDNVDLGDGFTYTGEGGRDLKGTKANPKNLRTAPQSKDQELTRGNLALSRNVASGLPVRVIRGYKLKSPFAPEEGYRYDGLYQVEKAWCSTGLSGFLVWKFAMKRCDGQAPPPWTILDPASPSKDSVVSDKCSVTGKSDSGFDSDETSSHFGSQTSDSGTSCPASQDGQSEKSEEEEEEEEADKTLTEEKEENVQSKDTETKLETKSSEDENITDKTEHVKTESPEVGQSKENNEAVLEGKKIEEEESKEEIQSEELEEKVDEDETSDSS